MTFRYRLWCPDCTGVDPDGCFDGGTELSEKAYATEQEAVSAALMAIDGSTVWRYDIEEAPG